MKKALLKKELKTNYSVKTVITIYLTGLLKVLVMFVDMKTPEVMSVLIVESGLMLLS